MKRTPRNEERMHVCHTPRSPVVPICMATHVVVPQSYTSLLDTSLLASARNDCGEMGGAGRQGGGAARRLHARGDDAEGKG